MPGRYSTRRRSRNSYPRSIVTSIKNTHLAAFGVTDVQSAVNLSKAVANPANTTTNDVSFGCLIKAIYLTIDMCGLAATGVLNTMDIYIMKNPGNNLTPPSPLSVGSSNEKKFVFRQWRYMAMRNQDGNPPYHWEGWIKIPPRYQRQGVDDIIEINVVTSATGAGHCSISAIYKWYR